MAPLPALNLELATRMKADIWEGMSNGLVAQRYTLSALTISLVRNGKAYANTPWPDGSDGALPDMQRQKMSRARQRDTLSGQAPARGHYPVEEEMRLLAIASEDIGRTFTSMDQLLEYHKDQIREERRVKELQTHKAQEDFLASPEGQAYIKELNSRRPPREVTRDDIVNPEANERLDWDYIMETAPGIPVVGVADAGEDHALKLAVQIVFKLLTMRQWKEDHTLRMVYSIKAKIERYWEEFGFPTEIETNCFKTSDETLIVGK